MPGHLQPGQTPPGRAHFSGAQAGMATDSPGQSGFFHGQSSQAHTSAASTPAGQAHGNHLGSQPLSRPQLAQLAEVGQRLLRLDERIEQLNQTGGASFLLSGQPLAHLESQDDGPLHATIPGAPARVLKDANAIEQYLDEAVSEYLRRQEGPWARPALT
jgi:hypothetical protein